MFRKVLFITIITVQGLSAQTPTASENYTMHRVMLDAAGTVGATEVQYYDGLGRPTVAATNANANGTDFSYTLQTYDAKGRDWQTWLPVAGGSSPDYISPASLQASALGLDASPYAENEYDALDRATKVWGGGQAWRDAGRSVRKTYRSNTAGEVRRYTVNAAGHLTSSGFHPAGSLSVEVSTDEDNRTLTVYRNVTGLTLLERRSTCNNTYFVYNDLDQLQYVLSPMASNALNSNGTWSIANNPTLRGYAYYYEYDSRGRCVKKKLPGCDGILYRYDRGDRLVFSQDGEQQHRGEATFYLYDHLGREAVRGICQASGFPDTENLLARAFIGQGGAYAGYHSELSLPSLVQLLQVNYYDTYAQIPDSAGYPFVAHEGYASQKADAHRLLTGKRVYLLGSPSVFYPTLYFYDNKGQAVLTRTRNFRHGINDTFTKYSFTGKPEKMHLIHRNGSQTVMHTEDFTYTYDGVDRPRKVMHSVDSNPAVKIAEYTYSDQGLVSRKETAGYSMTYDYNLRNWPTKLNASLFAEYLNYETSVEDAIPQYGGNISSMSWTASGLKGGSERGYTFAYDNLSRLTSSSYFSDYGDEDYEEQYGYDANGNINDLYRAGISYDGTCRTVDDLIADYSGNQLSKVYDNADDPDNHGLFHFWDGADADVEYQYDRNGNMTQDLNREISSVTYNVLNLPKKIQFEDNSYIRNNYTADGEKCQQSACISNSWATPIGNTTSLVTRYITEYCGNLEYRQQVGQTTKQYLHFDGGYITFEGTTPKYHFYVQDHLGNNRLVMSQTGQVEQEAQYYPSGAIMTDISTSLSLQPYLYSGKELDRMHGLDWYDYGARQYDAALLRWHTVDPLCEKYYHMSPYVFCGNNFVNAFDPDGKDWVMRKYDDKEEYYYDRNVRSAEQFNEKYKGQDNMKYIADGTKVTLGGSEYVFSNEGKGSVSIDGTKKDDYPIKYGKSFTIFGTADNSCNGETVHQNWYGSYTGPDNPLDYTERDSYLYIPENRSELVSMAHDILYDNAGAKGKSDAINNYSKGVLKADILFVAGNMVNVALPGGSLGDKVVSAFSASLFSALLIKKSFQFYQSKVPIEMQIQMNNVY